jgi:Ca2+-binding RTX toxin-like protein
MRRIILLLSLMGVMVALSATAAFAEVEYGTNGNDTLVGTDDLDNLYGLRGDDLLRGLGNRDWLAGGTGDDTVRGGGGGDSILLSPGNDTAYGGWGPDVIEGGLGQDVIFSEGGNDRIVVQDGVEGNDFVACGGGGDSAYVDSVDEVDFTTCDFWSLDPPPEE